LDLINPEREKMFGGGHQQVTRANAWDRLSSIPMDVFFFPRDQNATVDLYGLGDRCLHEPASRRLDGEIYCAIHNIRDCNPLVNDELRQARESGEVLLWRRPGGRLAWIEVPPFTSELSCAQSLLPEALVTFYRDARKVCATALQARALSNEPPPLRYSQSARTTSSLGGDFRR
jgi:hypothetical protein